MAKDVAKKVATRAIRRSQRKSGAVWELPTTSAEVDKGPGKQKERTVTRVTLDVIESNVSERESSHFGFVNITGMLKLYISSTHDLGNANKLICDGADVDIVKVQGRDDSGGQRYHIVFVRKREDATT